MAMTMRNAKNDAGELKLAKKNTVHDAADRPKRRKKGHAARLKRNSFSSGRKNTAFFNKNATPRRGRRQPSKAAKQTSRLPRAASTGGSQATNCRPQTASASLTASRSRKKRASVNKNAILAAEIHSFWQNDKREPKLASFKKVQKH